MSIVSINGMRVERAGNAVAADVRLRHRISPSDYVVVDAKDNVLTDAFTKHDDAMQELYALAKVPTDGGIPVLPLAAAKEAADPVYADVGGGVHFLHDPECMHRLEAFQ
ncbi:MAG: hypothetical protein ACREVL_14285 [Solimonas sp.]